MQNIVLYAHSIYTLIPLCCYSVIKEDHSRVVRHATLSLPTPAAYVRTLREEVLPSVLERRNHEQRTARELLIRHYQHPPPAQDQHSVFTRRVTRQARTI